MSRANEVDQNPYAAPQANCLHDEDLALILHRAVMIFRRMGWGGVLLFAAVSAVNFGMNLSMADPEFLVPMFVLAGYTAFFWSMLRTAKCLAENFDSAYGRARWIAIIAGAFFFPLLTLPCYFAIRLMEEYKRRYLREGRTSTDPALASNLDGAD
ncbi:MAG: hypothetical protein JSS49_14560 [Planctomycetes bacterium]|nr:hypothetical protein [Planctomycetota bacterium]